MNRRYSWTSHSEDESDLQREPDWQEVKFPIKFPKDAVEMDAATEWSVEVTTPDQEIILGSARMRRDLVNIKFQPFQDGVHKVQVLTDGRPFCPPLYFDILPDGSFRRLAAPPAGHREVEAQERSKQLKKRRKRPSQASVNDYSDDEDDGDTRAERRRVERRERTTRNASTDRNHHHSGYYSGYQPSGSDQYERRHSRASSVEARDRRSVSVEGGRRSAASPYRNREPSIDRPPSGGHRQSNSALSYGSQRQSSQSRPPSGRSQSLQRHDSNLSRQSSDRSYSQQHRSSSRQSRSVSDTESLISRQNSFSNMGRQRNNRQSRSSVRSRTSSQLSSNDEGNWQRQHDSGRNRSRTVTDLRSGQRAKSPPNFSKHKSSSNIQGSTRQRHVSAFALGAVPAQTNPPPFASQKSFSNELAGGFNLGQGQGQQQTDYEVISSPMGGDTFILKNQKMLSIRPLGKSAKGDELVQAEDGDLYLIKHGRATSMQQGYSPPADQTARALSPSRMQPAQHQQQLLSSISTAAVTQSYPDGKPRCSVCNKEIGKTKKKATLQGIQYCYKHLKDLFFNKPADAHKKFLFVDLTNVPAPGMVVHPRANFTGLSFKEFLKAQEEFQKYNPTKTGSIPKDTVYPLLHQLLLKNGIKENKLRDYFARPHYPKLLMEMQVTDQPELTELQFINLLAMITREVTHKWLSKVKVQKTKNMTKAWSTTALDTGHLGGAVFGDFTSQSTTGIVPPTHFNRMKLHGAEQSQAFRFPAGRQSVPYMNHSEPPPHHNRKQSRHTSESALPQTTSPRKRRDQTRTSRAEIQPHRRRPSDYDQFEEDDDDDDNDYEEEDVSSRSKRGQGRNRSGHSGQSSTNTARNDRPPSQRSRTDSDVSERHYIARQGPEGRSREDISVRSGTKVITTVGTRDFNRGQVPGAGRTRAQSSTVDVQQRKGSKAARTREEALAARAQLLAILNRKSVGSGTPESESSEEEKEGDSDEQADERLGDMYTGGQTPGQEHEPRSPPKHDSDADGDKEVDNDDDDEDDEESEESEVDSEQLLEDSDEEGLASQSDKEQPSDVPITGNQIADSWMLY